ncbi:putative endonuclease VII [Pectobacterium phage Arno162]|uniref:Putative endonuclease VII n=1 Tax=Pectobacterium phage Arno162 TaxID=2500577 RepID=A0A678ZS97_9CAUD|nr:putative endonuclease VII [Pectobacterium phage Arno162]
MLEVKVCSCCKVEKPVSEFGKDASRKDGLKHLCKYCCNVKARKYFKANHDKVREARREYYKTNPDKKREKALKNKYKIGLDKYEAMLARQGGVCAICGNLEKAYDTRYKVLRRLAVDHCHTTGVVRGLLCSACNIGIGKMRDSPELLRKAADYLESFRT